MSTRANIVLIEQGIYTDYETKKTVQYKEKLYFYKHSDGYPEGTMKIIDMFMMWLTEGRIRDNVSQSGGWLIILGAVASGFKANPGSINDLTGLGWKVGSIEPTTEIHGDIEYRYDLYLKTREVKIYERRGDWDNPTWKLIETKHYEPVKEWKDQK